MKLINKAVLPLTLMVFSACSFAADHTVGQKNKAFSTKEITIKVGDTIKFENQDPFFHNVYSLSDINTFDLGSYPKGENRAVKFDTAGKIAIECAIHPNMYMDVIVE